MDNKPTTAPPLRETTWQVGRDSDKSLDARWLLFGILIVYSGIIAIGAARGKYDRYWAHLGVPPMSQAGQAVPFGDTLYLLGVLECDRAGIDVYRENPCDPWARRMAYSRFWLLTGKLPLDRQHTFWLGMTIGLVFLGSVFAYVGRLNRKQAVLYGIVLCSPAIMLGIERGNTDLLVFALLVAALMLLSRSPSAWPYLLIALGGVLKLFPIAGLAVALRESRQRAAVILGTLGATWVAYLAWTWSDSVLATGAHEQTIYRAYGGRVLASMISHQLVGWGIAPSQVSNAVGYIIGIGSVMLAAVGVAWSDRSRFESNRLDGFRAGAAIYVATYLPLTNFDYKQVFLLLAIPQMLEWSRTHRVSALALVSMIVTFYLSSWRRMFFGGELLNLAVFGYCLYMLVHTRPSWLRVRAPTPASGTSAEGIKSPALSSWHGA
jgi:hypothetical protein